MDGHLLSNAVTVGKKKKKPWEFYVETVMGKTEKREVVGDLNSDKCHAVFLPGNISKRVLFTFWHLSFEIYLLLK